MIMMLGGLRELIATTVEDGGDIGDITEVAVRATQAMLGPNPRPAPRDTPVHPRPRAPVTRKLLTGNVGDGHVAGRSRRPGGE
jgi:hypothetical protein